MLFKINIFVKSMICIWRQHALPCEW